jgi:hypothetical protein
MVGNLIGDLVNALKKYSSAMSIPCAFFCLNDAFEKAQLLAVVGQPFPIEKSDCCQ